ncbi:TonB-dependent siderophore receptor [Niveispirillum sp.]|uniref:TonB-dependent siderophore receptor n=1 Tax=Niveispirillum sp. TaxID=1917217 RepID=UPI001B5F9E44|nr:TonB-dependent siderophore receptor [Niveispirillum sp.]MBP7337702.1 TonB-dependent siderophore receptor [Niveispirillum sp.]
MTYRQSSRRHMRTGTALCLSLALLAGPTGAQTAPDENDLMIDEILVLHRTEGYHARAANTATKLPLSLRETPQSITVMTRERIEDYNLITVADVLEQTPGITVQSYDSNRTRFLARGFPITNFQFDGVPTVFQTGAAANSVMSDTSIYERVEIVRGATGLVTGTGDPSATINMVRKRPQQEFAAATSLTYGSWNYKRAEADIGGPLLDNGRVRARIVGAYTDRESHVRFQRDKSPSLYGVIEGDITENTRLRVGVDYLRTDSQGGSWGASPLFYSDGTRIRTERSYSAASKWSRWQRDNVNLSGSLEQSIGEWVARLAYNKRRTDTESLLYVGSNSGATSFINKQTGLGLGRSDTYGVGETREDSLDAYASGPMHLFGRQHELAVGANYYDRDFASMHASIVSRPYGATFPSIYTWTGDIGRPTVQNLGIPRTLEHTSESGIYGAVRLNPIDGVRVIIGARYSDFETETENFSTASIRTSITAANTDTKLTPYLGAVIDLTDNLSTFASYSAVFRPQSQRDRENEQLAPLTGANYEAGLKGEFFDKRLYTALNGFHMQQDNVAELDPTATPGMLPDGADAYRAVKGVETWGAEAEVSGSITPQWRVTGGYTYARSEDQTGARTFTVSPAHMLRLFSNYQLGDYSVGGGVTWQSEIYQNQTVPTGRFNANGTPITTQGRVTQSAYLLADLMARYQVNDHVSVGVNATNIFDKKYYRNVGYFNAGYWGQPRRVLVNLRASM